MNRTPSGFIATSDISLAGRKRAHASISTSNVPETNRDARNQSDQKGDANGSGSGAGGMGDGSQVQAARKFMKYVDYDFSKMTDTKGGFLPVEDDPFNKALHASNDGAEQRPAHMTLKEWERHQLLKGLKNRKQGPSSRV